MYIGGCFKSIWDLIDTSKEFNFTSYSFCFGVVWAAGNHLRHDQYRLNLNMRGFFTYYFYYVVFIISCINK